MPEVPLGRDGVGGRRKRKWERSRRRVGLFRALFLLWDDDSQNRPRWRDNSSNHTKAGPAQVPEGAEHSSRDAVGRRNHQQKLEGRPALPLPLLLAGFQPLPGVHRPTSARAFGGASHLLCLPPSFWGFLKYNIVILGSLWPARGREVLPRWVDVLAAAGVPVICGLPPPGLTLGFLGAVIQGRDSHSLRLIIYVVRP